MHFGFVGERWVANGDRYGYFYQYNWPAVDEITHIGCHLQPNASLQNQYTEHTPLPLPHAIKLLNYYLWVLDQSGMRYHLFRNNVREGVSGMEG